MNQIIKKQIFERDNFTCQKCGFKSKNLNDLEIHHIKPRVFEGNNKPINLVTLCSICHNYAPDDENSFKKYLNEKIDGKVLETFRFSNYSRSNKTKKGMNKLFEQGRHITKAPKGYRLLNKSLILNKEEAEQVRNIFKEFLESDISLTQLAKKHDMTTAGIKKLLQNTTYLGKVKFAGRESPGQHEPIISKELFKKIQEKL